MPSARRFPPPWGIEEANSPTFIVKDNNGQALAYVYFEPDPGRRTAANLRRTTRPAGSPPILRSCRGCRNGRSIKRPTGTGQVC